MSYRPTLILLVVVGLLGGLLWMLQHSVEPTARRLAQSGRVLDLDLMHVESLVLQSGDDEMELVRRGAEWWIVRPVEARADEARIGQLLSASEALVSSEIITREQRLHRGLSLGDYGLDIPRASITYRTALGSRRLLLGHAASLGKQTYVRIDGESDVYMADADLRDATPDTIKAMRDHALMHGQPARVTRLEIERPGGGFVQLLRSAAGWVVQQPMREAAAPKQVNGLLEALYAARIEGFVWDPPVGRPLVNADARPVVDAPAVPVESYGLASDMSPARVRIWEAGDDVGRELVFGKPVEAGGESVYAMFSDRGIVFTLPAALLARFQLSVDDLRSRELVRLDPHRIRYLAVQQGDRKLALGHTDAKGWLILEPIQWPADNETVTGVIRQLTDARIHAFIDAPATNPAAPLDERATLRVTLDTVYAPAALPDGDAPDAPRSDKADGSSGRCELVAVDDDSDDLLNVAVSGRPGRYQVRRDALVFLPEATVLPLAFVDRTILAVAPERVQRITLRDTSRDTSREQILERDAEGVWRVVQPAGGHPDAKALSDILFGVSNLRAERVADQNPKLLSRYGLDAAAQSLTIGLSGGEAIQKIILLGVPADARGRYAMVQGQDVVFVLHQATVDTLMRGIVVPAQKAPAP